MRAFSDTLSDDMFCKNVIALLNFYLKIYIFVLM